MSNERFIIPELVSPADPDATTGQLQARFDTAQDALNTLGNEAALERQILHGIGRLSGEGCEITLGGDGVLRMTNGYFLAGPGVADDDDAYFIGARLVRVNGEAGYIELVGDDAPPLNQPDGVFGYMSAYGDVLWDDTKPPGAFTQNGRWCIGKAVTSAAAIVSADTDSADIVPGLVLMATQIANLTTRIEALESGGGSGSGGGFAYTGLGPWLPDPGDARATKIVIPAMIDAKITAALEDLQSGGERESPSETDLLWNWVLGYRRVLGVLAPSLLRLLPGGGTQPGLHGTGSAPDTISFDEGGTLPAISEEREYDSR